MGFFVGLKYIFVVAGGGGGEAFAREATCYDRGTVPSVIKTHFYMSFMHSERFRDPLLYTLAKRLQSFMHKDNEILVGYQ